MNLAVNRGATDILLLGFDMKMKGGTRHFFGEHPGNLRKCSGYEGWVRDFATMVPDCEARGIRIVNCTPDTALTCFPCRPLKECV